MVLDKRIRFAITFVIVNDATYCYKLTTTQIQIGQQLLLLLSSLMLIIFIFHLGMSDYCTRCYKIITRSRDKHKNLLIYYFQLSLLEV